MALPWKEMRRAPEDFPDDHVAKVSSARTVVGSSFVLNGRSERLYLKRSLLRKLADRLLHPFRPSKEWREFQLAREFGSRGVWVPKPVFYGEAHQDDGVTAIFLATQALEPCWIESKTFFKTARSFDKEWRSLAAFTRRLHDLDLYHADYRSDHLYLDPSRVGVWEDLSAWALIDLDGSQTRRPVRRSERERALLQLIESLITSGVGPEHVKEFLEVYDHQNRYRFDAELLFNDVKRKQER
jgi:hypothetical protein